MNKRSLVVQSNSLVEAKYRLSVEEQKIIKILIAQIQKNDKDFQDYEFNIKNLAELLGMEHSNAYGVLRNITKKLMSRVLEFHNPETNTILQTSWLSSALYKQGEGTIILRFDPSLKPLLLQLQSYFTKYELSHVLRFKGQYTIRFFEFRKSFLGRHKKIVVFPLDELREIFGLQKDEYRDFDNFRRRVLEPARVELAEKMSESFVWEAVRQGRGGKVVGVKVTFDGEQEKEIETPKPPLLPEVTEVTHAVTAETSRERAALLECGVSPALADELLGRYEAAYILEKIALAAAQNKTVKNTAGFIIEAIKGDWQDADVIKMKQEEERRRKEQQREQQKKKLRNLLDGYEAFKKKLGFEQYEKKSDHEKKQLQSEFLSSMNDPIRNLYRNKTDFGFEDGFFRSFFLQRVNIPSLETYLLAQDVVLSAEERAMMKAL